jgi:hypothetical protein
MEEKEEDIRRERMERVGESGNRRRGGSQRRKEEGKNKCTRRV